MKAKNTNLNKAKTAKNDEFYTQLSDIEKELGHYKDHFKDKIVFCNCDDPEESNFWFYFAQNFQFLGLKKLISTHYETDKPSYKLEIVKDVNADGKINNLDVIKTPLIQNGDFRSNECIELLKECDIVVTNPPFSLFREFVAQLVTYDKQFLIIGSQNAITYKETFELIKNNKVWVGYTFPKEFKQPDDSFKKFGNICWFTNIDVKKRHEDLVLYRKYIPDQYPKYDNYDAINVDKTVDIPMDYAGVMGVPISFMDKYNPEQFEILGAEEFENVEVRSGVFQKPTHKLEDSDRLVYKRLWIINKSLNKNIMGGVSDFPKYDNYDAINVDRVKDIPVDYTGLMGVPLTFMLDYNPDQFEIIGRDVDLLKAISGKASRFYINGKSLYARVVIKNKKLGVN